MGGARLAEGGGPAWLTLETLFLCTLCKLWLCALESPMPAVGVARAAVASVLWSQLQGHPKPPCLPESPGQWLERLSHKHLNSAESQNQNRDKKGRNPAALPWLTPTATPTARAWLPPAAQALWPAKLPRQFLLLKSPQKDLRRNVHGERHRGPEETRRPRARPHGTDRNRPGGDRWHHHTPRPP